MPLSKKESTYNYRGCYVKGKQRQEYQKGLVYASFSPHMHVLVMDMVHARARNEN